MSVQIIGSLTARQLPQRGGPIKAIIVHTTGDTDFNKIMTWYRSRDGLQPHYMIDHEGTIRRLVLEDYIAWHCKIEPLEARLYQRGYGEWSEWHWPLGGFAPKHVGAEFIGYRSWRETWGSRYQSPLELVTGDHPNTVSVGIELQSTGTLGAFTDAQYVSLAALVQDIHDRQGVALDREHVLGHQDCSPMRRSTAMGGWDPGDRFDWLRLWDLVRSGEQGG
jgi:N-acetyl-anhydromuramyl-L-alanine amidase AmpD